jgi:hypothetical protein
MDQSTHAWIALRALALLEECDRKSPLVALLKPNARTAVVGADMPDKKRGGNRADTHILKMKPVSPESDPAGRFVTARADLIKRLGPQRAVSQYLAKAPLDDAWWRRSYRGDVTSPRQHVPNRAMAVATMLKDLLILGDAGVDRLLPGTVSFIGRIDAEARSRAEQLALHYNALSHFLADATMPCHCDARNLADYRKGLHQELEDHWSARVGPAFKEKQLQKANPTSDQLLDQARAVDAALGIDFKSLKGRVPGLRKGSDVWLETIDVCRAAFALDCVIAPESTYDFEDAAAVAPFKTVFSNAAFLAEIDRMVLHDAVLHTAIVWKHVWDSASRTE